MKYMALIYSTKNFIVETPDKPHITRTDGGHITIYPKVRLVDRTQLSQKLAVELMRLTIITGKAMILALKKQGIDIGRINYQENGNWSVFALGGPHLHIHLYGRAKNAKINKYGDACYFPQRDTGFYDKFKPLNKKDIQNVKKEMESILKQKKYQDKSWGL